MGGNAKEKRPVNQCEECQKEFQSVRALKSHTMAKHPEKYKQMQALEQREFMSLLGNESASKDEKKTALVPPTSRVSRRLQEKKSNDKEMIVEDSIPSDIPPKQLFGCPKCDKVFQIYFSAYRHIQKKHCEDIDGNSIPPDSPHLIKPVRKEMCGICSQVKLSDHTCCKNTSSSASESNVKGSYRCLGCDRYFISVAAFDAHITAFHCDNIDTMIFETNMEFLMWKRDMESKAPVNYQPLSHSTKRKFYHCNYISSKNTADITHLCPSVLVAKEFSKGIQIHFYKKHYEHTCEYQIPEQFESYVIKTDTAKDAFDSLNEDLYIKLKNLLNSIMHSAVTAKVSKLKRLYTLAQEMQSCLSHLENRNNNDEILKTQTFINTNEAEDSIGTDIDTEDPIAIDSTENTTDKENEASKSMTDDQITQVLEKPRASARLKRKSESSEAVPKKKKLDAKDTKFESPKARAKPELTQSPSFNDTYKQFIDSTLQTVKSPIAKKAKKEIVKTKIGQFIPSPKRASAINASPENVDAEAKKTRSPINPPVTTLAALEGEIDIPSPKQAAEMRVTSEKVDVVKKTRNAVHSPKTSLLKMNQEKVDFVSKKARNVSSPRATIAALEGITVETPKIKDDAEKASIAVKKVAVKKNSKVTSPTACIADLNLEKVRYEVLEQENDCNILVLKI